MTRQELAKMDAEYGQKSDGPKPIDPEHRIKIRLPPNTAIAHRIIETWAQSEVPLKGRM